MILSWMPDNGVPWLEWFAEGRWICRRLNASGRLPEFTDVALFARRLGQIKQMRAGCGTFDNIALEKIGHPLNPDRAER